MAIKDYKNALGYKAPNLSIDGYTCPSKEGFCYKKIDANVNDPGSPNDRGKRYYYKIVTQISIDIPIINNIMPGLKIFQVTGDTKVIEQIK